MFCTDICKAELEIVRGEEEKIKMKSLIGRVLVPEVSVPRGN
jgi:hypothetical protein